MSIVPATGYLMSSSELSEDGVSRVFTTYEIQKKASKTGDLMYYPYCYRCSEKSSKHPRCIVPLIKVNKRNGVGYKETPKMFSLKSTSLEHWPPSKLLTRSQRLCERYRTHKIVEGVRHHSMFHTHSWGYLP